jgi:hypothetical protein
MNDRASTRGANAPVEIRLAVWQFVRVMVQLETASRVRGRAGTATLYGAWRPAWQEVDRRLTQLGQNDAAGFSELMMEQEVVLQCRNRAQLNELVRTVDNVVNQIKSEAKSATGDARRVTDLRFERTELETLSRRVRKLGKISGRGTSGSGGRSTVRSTSRSTGRATGRSTGRRGATR